MKLGHLVGVAGDDDDHVVAVVLDELDERVDGLVAEVAVAAPGQRVGLVDQQDAAERPWSNTSSTLMAVWPT